MSTSEAEKTAVELLTEFAGQTGRKVFLNEVPYPGSAIGHTAISHKRSLYITGSHEEKCVLAGFYDPRSLSQYDLFFGAFFPISLSADQHILIRKRNMLDQINPFPPKNTLRTGMDHFDSQTRITGTDIGILNRLFFQNKVQLLVLASLDISEGMHIGINEHSPDFVPGFQNRSVLGIFTRLKWFTEPGLLEDLLSKAEQLQRYCTVRQEENF